MKLSLPKKSNIVPSEPTNTPVELASQAEPEVKRDEPMGELPKPNALVNDRARVLKEIAERRNAQADAEAQETVDEETNPPQEAEEGKDLDTEETVVEAAPTTPAPPPVPAVEETKTIIVDGQAMQVPISKIIEMGTRTLQKEVAADVRLNQASKLLADAQKLAQPPQPDAAPAIESLNDDQLAELIQFGTKEQAAQAIKALRAPQLKQEDVLKVVQQAIPHQMNFQSAKQFAESEYGDLLSDPDLGAIFLARENAARSQGDTRGYVDLYKAIGDDLRVKFNRPKPGVVTNSASTVTVQTMQDKQAKKASAPAVPKLASARLDGEGEAPRAPTRAEVIDKLRAARGFAKYN